jgi:cytochrome c biogenesis protein CcdA
MLVGGSLGLVGAMVLPEDVGLLGEAITLAVASIAIARDSGLVAAPLPQLRRQTQGLWAKRFGGKPAAILWGLDLGLVFTTWLNLSGAWVLAAVAVLAGRPEWGAALFVAYWLGRAVSVWIAPLLMANATETHSLMAGLDEQRQLFRWLHVAGLASLMAVIGSWMVSGTSM